MEENKILKSDPKSFAGRQNPWRVAGSEAPAGAGVLDAMKAANLTGWDLRKVPLVHHDLENGMVPVKGSYVNLRHADFPERVRAIGVVGERYHNLGNEVVGEFIQQVVDCGSDDGIYVDSAGSIDGGARCYLVLGLKGSTVRVGGHDRIDHHLITLWSHDGSTALSVIPSPTRLACTNQIRGLLAGSRGAYKVRHLSGAGDLRHKVDEAREVLKVTSEYVLRMQEEAERLLAASVTDAMFKEMIGAAFPEVAKMRDGALTGRSATVAQHREQDLWGIWKGATVDGVGIGGTAWGAVQTVGEYVDWFGVVKGSVESGDALARARRTFSSAETVEAAKSRMSGMVSAMAGV